MDKYKHLRQFISNFIKGPNVDALLHALAEEFERQDQLAVAVTDQLTISTASDVYLDKRLAELGITRPTELGMDDLAFRQMGIQINAAKQITEVIHTILATFYGDETVRASTTSTISGPYDLADGDDLIFALEDGQVQRLTVKSEEFDQIQNAQVEELVDVITRYIRSLGYNGYAQVYTDIDTGEKYVRIFGGAKGPYGQIQVLGGKIQNKLEFPDVRPTELLSNTTVWEITRNIGSTHRFRWVSGPKPLLDSVIPGDKTMIYGNQFASLGIEGTFDVTGVRPAEGAPSVSAGYFEIDLEGFTDLTSSAPDQNPPPNTPFNTYSFTVTQSTFDDLKFFLPKKNTSYSQIRYALAWEPSDSLLKVYMPATTKVVRRDLEGSAHMHLLYKSNELNGTFGSVSDIDKKIIVSSEYSITYNQSGYDVTGTGGTLSYGINTIDIDYIVRENGKTLVFTKTPHGITGSLDAWGRIISNEIVTVLVANLPQDDQDNQFLGPYVVDPSAGYTLTDTILKTREKIIGGESRRTLLVEGVLPSQSGQLLFSLNKEEQEGPVKYLAAQTSGSINAVTIASISQVGTNVTVVTTAPHGMVTGEQVSITGTVNFNGAWTVTDVPSSNVYKFTKTPAATLFEAVGTSTPLVAGALTTLILDPSYNFEHTHEIGSDITFLSDEKAYEPSPDGSDYGFYVTGTADGRVFAEELIRQITALGINLEIIIIYPSDIGLGNQGESTSANETPQSEAVYVWGV